MEDKPFIPWSFINMPKKKNHDSEENKVPFNLFFSLEEKTLSSSSASTDTSLPFGSWSLFDVGGRNSMAEEKNQDSKKTNVPLDLSLSLGFTESSSSTSTDSSAVEPLWLKKSEPTVNFIEKIDNRASLSGPSEFGIPDLLCMENNNDSFLAEPTKIENVSLKLSLWFNESWRPEVGECNNHHNLKNGNNLKKVQTMENPKFLTNKNKRSKVEIDELRLGHDPWCIKKNLTISDLGYNARLMVSSKLVKSHILPHWNEKQITSIKGGLPVSVWDCDTHSQHELMFKVWNDSANVFIRNWTKDFVKRRELKLKDEIGLYWDVARSRFNFSVLNRASLQ